MIKDIPLQLERQGYAFIPKLFPNLDTEAVSRNIGTLVNIQSFLPSINISTVQTLKPRRKKKKLNNQYSGTFGLGSFPLHTDLAHWLRPPRYLVLRCIKGSSDVATTLISSSLILSSIDKNILKRAVVSPRRLDKKPCLLPLIFTVNDVVAFRWDSLFLNPVNKQARLIFKSMETITSESNITKLLYLSESGDTLIIDNWKNLHGRTSVKEKDTNREIERVYLEDIIV